jgi:two-component system, OmpR family, response regulator
MARILVVEDDVITAGEMLAELQGHGNEVDSVGNGVDGLERALTGRYDAITLDRMLPQLDGLSLIMRLREAGVRTPVLMISALSDGDERIRGLRAGGDDYLTKPFAPDEMTARIDVLLRRDRLLSSTMVLHVADLELDLLARDARRGGIAVELLPLEFKLLEYLMRNSGQVLTRTMIFQAVWGYHFDPGTNVIDVHMGRLRRKIDVGRNPSMIRAVRGRGYVLGAA